ncbi:MAG: glycosyltransferase family 4 protein [Verrucomicrobiaceae bacterium]|nr:glycosyltransferase family 4 protein [Verrucomicrobiaceae bacterium]
MRIALVHYTAPPVIGGVERILEEHRRLFEQKGHDVEFITSFTPQLPEFDVVAIHNVLTMPFNPEFAGQLRALMASTPQVKWINWVHDVGKVNQQYAHLPWNAEAPPNCIHVAVSQLRRGEYARAVGLSEADVHVIPNGIDCAKTLGLSDFVSGLNLWQEKLILFHPTRIVRRKNIELGLRVTAALPDALYVVTGAPDPHNADHTAYMQEVITLSRELRLQERVKFVGAVSDDDIRSLYTMADALFFPSKSEGFGLPLLEAELHGVPVFCSDIPAHREVGSGQFFGLDDEPSAIASRIVANESVRMRQARRDVFARHGWDAIWSTLTSKVLPDLRS